MVNRDTFDAVAERVCASGPPSDGDNLLGFMYDVTAFLQPGHGDRPRLWREMYLLTSVTRQGLIEGRAAGKSEDDARIASELARIWEDDLRYRFLSASTVTVTPSAVVLEAITQIAKDGFWVRASVEVELDLPLPTEALGTSARSG